MQKLLLLTSTFALVFMGAGCDFLPTDREEVLVPEPVVTMHENWETYEDRKVRFMYPKEIESEYVVTEEWPPTIEVIRAEISCAVEVSIIEDRVYCSKVESEGAAGSVYKSYYHSIALGSSGYLANVTFTLRFPQCLNYDESEQAQCKEDQADENIDQLIDEIIQTLVIK